MKQCEQCGAEPAGYNLLDYCAECSADLCAGCMAQGCCGQIPAASGHAELAEEETEDTST